MIQRTDKRKIRYFEGVRSDTDATDGGAGGEGIWCSRLGKYVKPKGAVDGVTQEECNYPVGKPKYQIVPTGVGELDS